MENVPLSPLAKQENTADVVFVTHGGQVGDAASGHHVPAEQLPLVSASTQEDLWHLPGRLRINPSLWDKDDVTHWLHWAQKEYSLRRPERGCFEMNGRALCLLTKEDFRRRCPSSGDVLFEILQCVKRQRRTVVCKSPRMPVSLTDRLNQSRASRHVPTQRSEDPHPPFTNDTRAVVSTSPPKEVQCPPQPERITQEPLNLSSREERPRSPLYAANGRIPECRLLWDYVYLLLCDDRYQEYIRWEDKGRLVFRVVDPNGLARLWGNHKNRENMTYEKMSRALRHYYKLNIIKKERGQKLLFRFLKTPQNIRKQQPDPPESPEHTPSQDREFPDNSPTLVLSNQHFEVSPACAALHPSPTAAPVR